MPRYKLRTLLILLAIGPPMLAGVWALRQFTKEKTAAQSLRAASLKLMEASKQLTKASDQLKSSN